MVIVLAPAARICRKNEGDASLAPLPRQSAVASTYVLGDLEGFGEVVGMKRA